MRADDDGIIGDKPDPTAGLALFARANLGQILDVAAPLVALARSAAPAAMPGAGQAARAAARGLARPTTEDAYRRIARSLEVHGPQTRRELEVSCGMPVNTINARVAELRDPEQTPEYADWRLVTDGRREGQGIVHLARLHRRPPAPPTAPPPAPPTVPSPEDPV